jgi:hypothetical protein
MKNYTEVLSSIIISAALIWSLFALQATFVKSKEIKQLPPYVEKK